jgi:hypothetical protein
MQKFCLNLQENDGKNLVDGIFLKIYNRVENQSIQKRGDNSCVFCPKNE